MAKKKTETAGLMPNGNIVKYDTTETPKLPVKPKRKYTRKKVMEISREILPDGVKCNLACSPSDYATPGGICEKNGCREPIEPAPITTEPAEPLTDPLEEAIKNLTPEQLEIGERQAEAGELYQRLLKTMKPRAARRMVLKKLAVRIDPDNSQPYVKPKEEKNDGSK